MKRTILFSTLLLSLSLTVGCNRPIADIVVYGSVHTSEGSMPVAEALAVEDGRYIYVGDKSGVEPFIREGTTRIIDHTDKGIVMPCFCEGISHYLMDNTVKCMGGLSIDDSEDGTSVFLQKVKSAYERANLSGKACIYGFGWNYDTFLAEGMPTRGQLDVVCPDISLFVNDAEGCRGLANTTCLRIAGIMDSTGKVLVDSIGGGKICMDADGKPDGLLLEQAATFVRDKGIDFEKTEGEFIHLLCSKDSLPDRGIIMTGNYADFILVDKEDMQSAIVLATFFEGKEMFQNLR